MIVTREEFPDGLQCSECGLEIPFGEEYAERRLSTHVHETPVELFGEVAREVSVVELVCLACEGPETEVITVTG